jgi:hypothetical protein
MSSFEPFLPLLTVAVIAAVTLYVSRLRRSLKAFEVTVLVLLLSIPLLMLGIYRLDFYGMGIFVALPLLIGFVSVLLYGRNAPERTWRECRNIAIGSTLAVGTSVLLAGIEGVVCLAMASPIVLFLSLAGGVIAYSLRASFWRRRSSPALLLLLLLSAPLLMGAEAAVPRQAPVYAVRTAVEIDAPPEAVWRNVVSFRQLPPPDDWVFHTGIAYPVRAEIRGRGVGAVRYCEFSTGPFVEPIVVWDEPRRLAFRVTANPPALQELSPWGTIHPPHVRGFLVSRRGQFLLTPLPGGRTRLEGTTWYQHGLYPAGYWRLWSDWIIHSIHLRVLDHVKRLSEEGTERLAL